MILRIDTSSIRTLVNRMNNEMPGVSFIVTHSAHEGKVVVSLTDSHRSRADEFAKLVRSL